MRYSIEFKYRFEVLIPFRDNQGKPFPSSKLDQVGATLLEQFGGCYSQPLSPYLGLWRTEERTYREGLLMWVVDTPRSDESLGWFLSYKRRLRRQFRQVEIYLAMTEVMWL
jgi:hypothetical protein